MRSSCKLLFECNQELLGLVIFFLPPRSIMSIFHWTNFVQSIINIFQLSNDVCNKANHGSLNLSLCAWAFSCFSWAQRMSGHVLWWKQDMALHSCSGVATVKTSKVCFSPLPPVIGHCLPWFFAQFFFLMVLLLTLSFPIKCRFSYLNLSYWRKENLLMMGYFFLRAPQASVEKEALKGDR